MMTIPIDLTGQKWISIEAINILQPAPREELVAELSHIRITPFQVEFFQCC